MKNDATTRTMRLGVTLLLVGTFAACQDAGPTNVGTDVSAQLAKGGNGNGGGGGPPTNEATPITITLSGGMIAVPDGGVANGQYGTNTEDRLELAGVPFGPEAGGCTTANDPDCFWNELALDYGVQQAGGYGQCVGHRKQPADDRARLLSKLDSPSQARFVFRLEYYDRVSGTARLRNIWYEEDNPDDRYTFFLITDDVDEIGGPGQSSWDLVFTNGVISMYGTGHKALTCNWQDTITLSIGEPTG